MCGQKSPDPIISTYIMHVCLGYAPYMYGVHVYTVPTCGLFLALCIVTLDPRACGKGEGEIQFWPSSQVFEITWNAQNLQSDLPTLYQTGRRRRPITLV